MKEKHLEYLHVVFECFHEFNLKLKESKCLFFHSEIVYLVHHVSHEGICSSKENVCVVENSLCQRLSLMSTHFAG